MDDLVAVPAGGGCLAYRPFAWPVPYQSDAELLIKWVATSHPVGQNQESSEAKIVTLADQGDSIINSEIRILTSQDVITQVVDIIGAPKLLDRAKGDTNRDTAMAARMEAAEYIKEHLITGIARDSDIITSLLLIPDRKYRNRFSPV